MDNLSTALFFIVFCYLITGTPEGMSYKIIESSNKTPDENVTNKLICYYVFTLDFKPKIMTDLCTHINVGFFQITKDNYTLAVTSEMKQILQEFSILKKYSQNTKLLISVGGAGAQEFSEMVANHANRKKFIRSCLEILKKYKFDGIDLDWEWPVIESGNSKEKVKFVQLLNEIRRELNRHKKKYILSADVSSAQPVIELGYYVNYIANAVDYVNVMCYDYNYFTKYYPFTGHNSPLYSPPSGIQSKNINYTIHFWISKSMPREKIVIGIPTYGHTYKLTHSNQHSLFAPTKGFGSVGNNGFANYPEICKFIKEHNATVVYDSTSKVPYAYEFPEWISFDDETSLAIKADYILQEKLAGAMVFAVNSDDINGTCNGISLPLLRKIRNILLNTD